ncbi:hypothetical protein C1X75_06405 [Pseudomonas sp. FW305-17]|nr:hypothetical protein C1X79_12125 [Pseudomonas sp. FW305-42]PNA21828.1 hypothetical protein C1X78_18445 [Pseudomonas sp. MPR-R1B]PNB29208.1 hypothetical protein C1X80_02260 [Pseudomonas sp. DP16D-E2]PNB44376.1 hypothetical protein C1X75_06405 [Pseudomonas sp. FW305-17]PNB58379.1 hypothetical protein C1X77_18800 [Pseudomonas sp. GW531-E2]PNB69855.1 hypothetical protein C1X76_01970 [Pseudomonas sp. FW305-127]
MATPTSTTRSSRRTSRCSNIRTRSTRGKCCVFLTEGALVGAALAAMRASRCLAPASRVIAAEAAPTGRMRSYNPASNAR